MDHLSCSHLDNNHDLHTPHYAWLDTTPLARVDWLDVSRLLEVSPLLSDGSIPDGSWTHETVTEILLRFTCVVGTF